VAESWNQPEQNKAKTVLGKERDMCLMSFEEASDQGAFSPMPNGHRSTETIMHGTLLLIEIEIK